MLNILTEPVIRIDVSGGGQVEASLPETFALLMQDKVDTFPALRPHQRHPLHAFLVQLGAIAMRRAGLAEPPTDPDTWRAAIRALTPDFPNDEPWRMVVTDITKPAFLQPPASSEAKLADYKHTVESPDELDMLVTSKNHDLKSSVALPSCVDDWLFALITLQTAGGFSGRKNYGISRMNGAYGSRVAFTITLSPQSGAHFRRDMLVLLERRKELMDKNQFVDDGLELIWTRKWDGAKSEYLNLNELDAFYIEICRRIRLRSDERRLTHAIRATSEVARINAKALNGLVGDPWTPTSDDKSLGLSSEGFTYSKTAEYINAAKWEWAPLFKPTDAEIRSPGSLTLIARGMKRGRMPPTEGYHERHIPIKPQTKARLFGRGGGAVALGTLAEARVKDVAKIRDILEYAIAVFDAGGRKIKRNEITKKHRKLSRPLDDIVDMDFFDALQEEFSEDNRDERANIRRRWLGAVVDSARGILRDAGNALPCPVSQRFRARVRAEGVFEGSIRGNNGFPMLFEKQEEDDTWQSSDQTPNPTGTQMTLFE